MKRNRQPKNFQKHTDGINIKSHMLKVSQGRDFLYSVVCQGMKTGIYIHTDNTDKMKQGVLTETIGRKNILWTTITKS